MYIHYGVTTASRSAPSSPSLTIEKRDLKFKLSGDELALVRDHNKQEKQLISKYVYGSNNNKPPLPHTNNLT